MSSTFVHGLWGETAGSENPTLTLPRTLKAIRHAVAAEHQPEPLVVYCYGEDNREFLREHGIEPLLCSPDPIHNFLPGVSNRNCQSKGRLNWGLNFWRHKLDCIQRALDNHDEVVWLDWDVRQLRPLDDFWSTLREGPPIQAALRAYKRPQCGWRARGQRTFVPHGAFIYCRSLVVICRVIDLHIREHPTCTDEIAIAHAIDELLGGWTVPDKYRDHGFEPTVYDQRRKYVDPSWVSSNPVFRNVGRW